MIILLIATNFFFMYRYVAITFDGWTSTAGTSFLTVSGHFIPEKQYEIETATLCLINSSAVAHSGEEYAQKIKCDVIEKLKFVENNIEIVCATTDNARNMITTTTKLGIKHLGCFDHTM